MIIRSSEHFSPRLRRLKLAQSFALFTLLAFPCFSTTVDAAADVIIDLGTFSDGAFSFSGGINAFGQVAGQAETQGSFRAFFWDAQGGMRNIGTLGFSSSANGINALGQIVGRSETALGERAFLWDASNFMRNLGTLPSGTSSRAFGINVSGQVVGDSDMGTGVMHAVLWSSNGSIQDLGTLPGGSSSSAYAVNDRGQVIGESSTPTSFQHAFIWEAGVMRDLGTLPGGNISVASAINNRGQVVGFSDTGTGAIHAFLWEPVQGMTDLGTTTTNGSTIAFGINDIGQVVGQENAIDGTSKAFLWEAGIIRELSTPPGTTFAAAYGINEIRQVAGAMNAPGDPHAVVWQLNRPPVADSQSVTTTEDVAANITLTGSDPDNDPVTFSIVVPPTNGSLSGTPPNVTYTSLAGFSGTDQFTFTMSDGTTTSAIATVSITVNGAPQQPAPSATLTGHIHGDGHLNVPNSRHHFEFKFSTTPAGRFHNWLHYRVHSKNGAYHHSRFVSTAIISVIFSDDPTTQPSRRGKPIVDTVSVLGVGRWNGSPGYSFEMRATDAGEPGRRRDSFTLTIKSPDGVVVAAVSGVLAGGNIQSFRQRR